MGRRRRRRQGEELFQSQVIPNSPASLNNAGFLIRGLQAFTGVLRAATMFDQRREGQAAAAAAAAISNQKHSSSGLLFFHYFVLFFSSQ